MTWKNAKMPVLFMFMGVPLSIDHPGQYFVDYDATFGLDVLAPPAADWGSEFEDDSAQPVLLHWTYSVFPADCSLLR